MEKYFSKIKVFFLGVGNTKDLSLLFALQRTTYTVRDEDEVPPKHMDTGTSPTFQSQIDGYTGFHIAHFS
jgi:hypothetical protein